MAEQLQNPTPDVTPPELTFQDTWGPTPGDPDRMPGPQITIRTPNADGAGEEPLTTVYVEWFEVSTGGLVDAVVSALGTVESVVTGYDYLRTEVLRDEDWIFAVSSEADIGGDGNPYNGGVHTESTVYSPGGGQYVWTHTEVNDYYGASPEQVKQLNTYQHQLLAASADVITLVGQYIMAVDSAAQAYANMDYACQFPDPPQITEIFV